MLLLHSFLLRAFSHTFLFHHLSSVCLSAHSSIRYHKLLTPFSKDVDIWTTDYLQQLPHGGTAKQVRTEGHRTSLSIII